MARFTKWVFIVLALAVLAILTGLQLSTSGGEGFTSNLGSIAGLGGGEEGSAATVGGGQTVGTAHPSRGAIGSDVPLEKRPGESNAQRQQSDDQNNIKKKKDTAASGAAAAASVADNAATRTFAVRYTGAVPPPPYFNLASVPRSVSLIYNSYITSVYTKFRNEVLLVGGGGGGGGGEDSSSDKKKGGAGLGIPIGMHAASDSVVETPQEMNRNIDAFLGGLSKEAGVDANAKERSSDDAATDDVHVPMLYPPMLAPYRYVGGISSSSSSSDQALLLPPLLSSCPALARQDYKEFNTVVKRVDLYKCPLYNMPWHFHDPNPLCGRYFYRFLENFPVPSTSHGIAGFEVARVHSGTSLNPVPLEYFYGKRGETDRMPVPQMNSLAHYPPPLPPSVAGNADNAADSITAGGYFRQRNLHRLTLLPTSSGPPQMAEKTTASSTSAASVEDDVRITKDGLVSIAAVANTPFYQRLGLEGCSPESAGDDEGLFIVARLVGADRVVAVDTVKASAIRKKKEEDSKSATNGDGARSILRFFNFMVPDIVGTYRLEVKYVHANSTSTSPKDPKSLGVVGIRANDKGKSFKYNTICDVQRHVYGSPMEVRVVAAAAAVASTAGGANGASASPLLGQFSAASAAGSSSSAATRPIPPLCKAANHSSGMWVRFTKGMCSTEVSGGNNPLCIGDPSWLTDAAGFNTGLLWVPLSYDRVPADKAIRGDMSVFSSSSGSSAGDGSDSVDVALSDSILSSNSDAAALPRDSPPHLTSSIISADAAVVGSPTIPCRYLFHSPPGGPPSSCLKLRENGKNPFTRPTKFGGSLVIVGDSVMREYSKNCALYNFRGARIVCAFNNIVLEGQHYSRDYARAVALNILQAATRNKASHFATNLGIHHMVGPCTTQQWIEFVDIFAEMWKKAMGGEFHLATEQELEAGDVSSASQETFPSTAANNNNGDSLFFVMEKAIWIGPPAVHYARRGMGFQRAALWDQLAWERLAPLGFHRLNAIAPTMSRQEATWDGLHYAAERGKVQTPLRDRTAVVRQWNGGVSGMLFTMLLNMICN